MANKAKYFFSYQYTRGTKEAPKTNVQNAIFDMDAPLKVIAQVKKIEAHILASLNSQLADKEETPDVFDVVVINVVRLQNF